MNNVELKLIIKNIFDKHTDEILFIVSKKDEFFELSNETALNDELLTEIEEISEYVTVEDSFKKFKILRDKAEELIDTVGVKNKLSVIEMLKGLNDREVLCVVNANSKVYKLDINNEVPEDSFDDAFIDKQCRLKNWCLIKDLMVPNSLWQFKLVKEIKNIDKKRYKVIKNI